MFYKVWSGAVKHIRTVLFQSKKPVELPGFAIFAPTRSVKPRTDQAPSEIACLVSGATRKDRDQNNIQVKLILHNDFINKCAD